MTTTKTAGKTARARTLELIREAWDKIYGQPEIAETGALDDLRLLKRMEKATGKSRTNWRLRDGQIMFETLAGWCRTLQARQLFIEAAKQLRKERR